MCLCTRLIKHRIVRLWKEGVREGVKMGKISTNMYFRSKIPGKTYFRFKIKITLEMDNLDTNYQSIENTYFQYLLVFLYLSERFQVLISFVKREWCWF